MWVIGFHSTIILLIVLFQACLSTVYLCSISVNVAFNQIIHVQFQFFIIKWNLICVFVISVGNSGESRMTLVGNY